MKRVLAAAVLMACMPTAHAQDKGNTQLTHSAEYRVRDVFMQNEAGNKDTHPNSSNAISHRFKLGLDFRSGEKFGAHLTLLHNATWGQDSSVTDSSDYSAASAENIAAVNEAYASWMMSNDFNMKFGRMNYGFGDGSVMGYNDWEATPNSYEGVLANYEAEFGRFQAFAFKYREMKGTSGFTASDAEHNAYALIFDLKTMPDWLKGVNAHIIKDNADGDNTSTQTTVNGTQGQDTLRYGLTAKFAFSMVDLTATYEGVTGKYHFNTAPQVNDSVSQNMMQAELGLNFPNFMKSRVFVSYHQDSGDDNTTDTTDKTYDAYYHQRHGSAGMMDLVGWGNLTDIAIGWTVKPTDNLSAGIEYSMFSKTKDGANANNTVNAGDYGTSLFASATATDKSNIGNEIDLWASHKYDGGLSICARLGMFTPGDALKDATTARKDNITQGMVQGKLTF